MRWQSGRRSTNLNDARRTSKAVGGGGLALLGVGVIVALLGGDPTAFFVEGINRTIQTRTERSEIPQAEQDKLVDFVSVVLAGTEDTWNRKFQAIGRDYAEPQLVVFSGTVGTQCGNASRALGPFYCPLDQTIYLDLEFFNELSTRFGAPGDFAQAYVVAHEVGHHVQQVLGILDQADRAKSRMSRIKANAISVQVELMADCLAGVWGHETQSKNLLEDGDVEEALLAASKIGDDALQKQTQGAVVPDSFTHGTSDQRYAAFKKGFESGELEACIQSK